MWAPSQPPVWAPRCGPRSMTTPAGPAPVAPLGWQQGCRRLPPGDGRRLRVKDRHDRPRTRTTSCAGRATRAAQPRTSLADAATGPRATFGNGRPPFWGAGGAAGAQPPGRWPRWTQPPLPRRAGSGGDLHPGPRAGAASRPPPPVGGASARGLVSGARLSQPQVLVAGAPRSAAGSRSALRTQPATMRGPQSLPPAPSVGSASRKMRPACISQICGNCRVLVDTVIP